MRRTLILFAGFLVASVVVLAGALPAVDAAGRRSKLGPDEARLMDLVDRDRAFRVIEDLAAFGERSVGSAAENAAQDYVAREFASLGLTVERHRFASMTWDEKPGGFFEATGSGTTLSVDFVTYGLNQGVFGLLDGVPYSFGTDASGEVLEAQLVDAGLGTVKDYRGVDVTGKVVFIRRDDFVTFWPTMPVIEAASRGALAAVFYGYAGTWTLDDGIKQDAVGGPIPAFSISRTDAMRLQDMLASGHVDVRISSRVDMTEIAGRESGSQNVVAYMRGSRRPDEYVLLSGHVDSWFVGAEDDASGVAVVLEAARALTEARRQGWFTPDRTIVFLSVGAEELGAAIDSWFDWAIGSYNFYLDHPEIMRNTVATINNDGVGFGETATMGNTVEAGGIANALIRDLGFADRIHMAFGQSSFVDGWVYGPVAGGSNLQLFDNPGYISTIYHTQLDDLNVINLGKLDMAAKINTLGAYRLSRSLFNPIEIDKLADWAIAGMAEDQATARTPELSGAFAAATDAIRSLKEEYLALLPRIQSLGDEYKAPGTSAARRAQIQAQADVINAALRDARYTVSRFLWGTGTTLGGWISIFRTEQHAHDLRFVNEALEALRDGRLRDALGAIEDVYFMDWAHKFSKITHDEVASQHDIGTTPPIILQWGGEWGQQQEYVFLHDAYTALKMAAAGREEAPSGTEAALADARADLIGFVVQDLENIRTYAEAAEAILADA